MRLPSFKRIISTDFKKDFKDLVDQLALSLNNGIDLLYTALANNLTLRDNFKATVKDILVTTDSNGNPTSGASFKLTTGTAKIDGILVLSALNQVNSAGYATSGVFITGGQSGDSFIINNITGLIPGQSYSLRIVAFAQ